MTFLSRLVGILSFRSTALRAQAERQALFGGVVCFCVGLIVYALVRNSVYAALPELSYQTNWIDSVFNLNLIQILLFLLIIYLPAIVVLSNSISGYGFGFSVSKREYRAHASALLPMWGLLFLVAAPLQWLVPHFLVISSLAGGVEFSVGWLVRALLIVVYTPWAIKQLNYLSPAQAIGVFILSWFTWPVYYLVTSFVFALPFFILVPLMYFAYQRLRDYAASHVGERTFQQQLHALTLNPQDSDAHYQLGLLQLKRGNLDAARQYFESAAKIDPNDPDYCYFLGRTFEKKGEWAQALAHYEETYRLNPEYGTGDIFREVGKGYLHTGSIDKAIEFLKFFLNKRNSDPEGRYWLAVALKKSGDIEQMKVQLNMIVEQARSHPRFFRRENREWLYLARNIIRDSKFEIENHRL
jgi:tetratricopeptide (TPR) repeat protein